MFCNIEKSHVFESPDVETIYEIPLVLYKQEFDKAICKRLCLGFKRHKNFVFPKFDKGNFKLNFTSLEV